MAIFMLAKIDRMPLIVDLTAQLPTLEAVLILLSLRRTGLQRHCQCHPFDDAIVSAKPVNAFVRVGFNDPLYILYSAAQPVRQNALSTALAAL